MITSSIAISSVDGDYGSFLFFFSISGHWEPCICLSHPFVACGCPAFKRHVCKLYFEVQERFPAHFSQPIASHDQNSHLGPLSAMAIHCRTLLDVHWHVSACTSMVRIAKSLSPSIRPSVEWSHAYPSLWPHAFGVGLF